MSKTKQTRKQHGDEFKAEALKLAKLKRQLAEQTEEISILKKAATYFAKNQK